MNTTPTPSSAQSDFQLAMRRMYQKAYDFAAMVARMQNK